VSDHEHLDPDLDPEQEARVRALLADLGSAPDVARMPPSVAARLEDTLDSLVAEQSAADVVPLRRRWAPRLAAAAAAVIVVGIGSVAVGHLGGSGSADTATSDGAAGGRAGTGSESFDSSAPSAGASAPEALTGEPAARLPHVTAATFDADVTRLLHRSPAPQRTTANQRRAAQDGAAGTSSPGSCPGPPTRGEETTEPVLYDGTRAVLVIHPAEGGRRLVEAYSCVGRVLDSTRVADPGVASPSPTP
jgi:hypothetical protein